MLNRNVQYYYDVNEADLLGKKTFVKTVIYVSPEVHFNELQDIIKLNIFSS